MALILLTNDDGIAAEGLRRLDEFLQGLGEIIVIAPDRERSAVSHGLTITVPLEHGKVGPRHYILNGTPADCIIYGLKHLTGITPDLVVSGINHGANLAEDIIYSGTVAAAREASRRGIPALAVSQAYDEKPISFREGARFIRSLARALLLKKPHPGMCLNINIPVGEVRGTKITRQGCSSRSSRFNSSDRSVESGESFAWSDGVKRPDLALDLHAIGDNYISITPLQRDQTDYSTAQMLREEMPRMLQARRMPRLGLIE